MTNKKILTLISLLLLVSFLMVGCFPKPNLPPEIISEAVETATVGVAYTYDVDATDPNPGDVLTYSLTTEPSGMLINATSGKITWTPTAAGDFDVTVQVLDDRGLSDTQSFTITVGPAEPEPELELTGIEVVPETMTLVVGKSEAIKSVTATYEIRGYEFPIALGDCTYASNATGIATVSDAGLVTAVAEGTATITVTYSGVTDTLEVTVGAVEFDHIVVLPETMTLYLGGVESKAITSITAYNNDGTKATVDFGDCIYGLSDSSIATVEASTGDVTAVVLGETTITVSYEEEGITKTDTIEVTVLAFELDHIVVVPGEMIFDVEWGGLDPDSKDIEKVTAYYNDESFADIIPLSGCTFKPSDILIANVDDNGVVTAKAKGSATITVSYTEEEITKTDAIEVTVPNRAPSITDIQDITHVITLNPFTQLVKADDPDDDVLTYFLDTFPLGMNIGPTTGVISWYPTDTCEAVTVKVGVSDGELEVTDSFDITVTGTP